MFLPDIENNPAAKGAYAELIAACRGSGAHYPQIWHLFAFKPNATQHLERFTHEIMRGPSPLSPGMRELIAALTSAQNRCPF
jgi:alkylhydroperoxidase family enzyme